MGEILTEIAQKGRSKGAHKVSRAYGESVKDVDITHRDCKLREPCVPLSRLYFASQEVGERYDHIAYVHV